METSRVRQLKYLDKFMLGFESQVSITQEPEVLITQPTDSFCTFNKDATWKEILLNTVQCIV